MLRTILELRNAVNYNIRTSGRYKKKQLTIIHIYIYTYTAGYGRTMISARDTRLKIVRITRAHTIRNIQYTRADNPGVERI